MDERPRYYVELIDWCASCPAHICLKGDRGCRCGVMDRKIPKKYEIEMSFPEWCPCQEKLMRLKEKVK